MSNLILFQEDWKKFPNAIIDLETRNQSFVRLSAVYREMGIKNNSFILALLDRDLVGVDPFDPYISPMMQGKIAVECKLNPWYYFREIAKAPPRAGSDPINLQANRGNIALYWSFFNHILITLIQIRQTGKSFSVDELATYLMNIRCTNTEINLLTKDDSLRATNIERLKEIDKLLPFYLRQRTKSDLNNTEEIKIKSLNNWYRGHLPQKSPKMANNLGRGLTSPIFFIDEPPFQPNIGIALPAALAAGGAARDIARLNDEPYGTILTTTAGKKDDRDGGYVFNNFVMEAADWSEHFFDCSNLADLENTIRRNSIKGKLRIHAAFNHQQLGKTDEWLDQQIEDAAATGEEADRDFRNRWTSGSATSPLDIPTLEKIRAGQMPPLFTEISGKAGYITRWYIEQNIKQKYIQENDFVLSLDTSDASGGDDISLHLVNIKTGYVVCAGNFNETNLILFAEWLVDEWFTKFDGRMVCIPERRSSAVAIIDYLLLILPAKGIDPFKVIFNWVVNNADEDKERFREISAVPLGRRSPDVLVKYKKTFGFATSGSGLTSRTELYSNTLQNSAKTVGDRICDITTINQLTSLINLNGRIDHPPGGHDDMVISWLLANWFMTKGKNLSFYSFNSKLLLTELRTIEIKSLEDQYDFFEQQDIRRQIETIYEDLKNETDEILILKLENELKALNTRLILEENEQFSVHGLIEALRNERKSRLRARSVNYDNYNYAANQTITGYHLPYQY